MEKICGICTTKLCAVIASMLLVLTIIIVINVVKRGIKLWKIHKRVNNIVMMCVISEHR